jgi:hypothetical protein
MKQPQNFLFLALTVSGLWLSSCGGGQDDVEDVSDSALFIPRTELARTNQLVTMTGKTWIVSQTPMLDSSLISVVVHAIGFSADTISFDLGETDPVTELRVEDLDRDGFQELYILTQSTDKEAYGTVYGLYADQDTSVTIVSFEGATPYTIKEGEPYDGYRGHDQFRFEKGVLTNSIPVFSPDDPDETPGRGTRTIAYELIKGATTVRLQPVKRK